MNTANTKVRTITIKKADVFFDVDFLSLLYSHTIDEPTRADVVASETQATNGNRIITRMCDHKVSDLKESLKKFIEETTASSVDDTLASSDWVFTIRITTEAEDNIFKTLADLFHQYIVDGALAEWYAQANSVGNREALQAQANAALARIRELIYYRPMP